MSNFSAWINGQSVENTTLTYSVVVMASDGATYPIFVDVQGSVLSGNVNAFNQAIRDAIEAKLLDQFGIPLGLGNKIILMGGGV